MATDGPRSAAARIHDRCRVCGTGALVQYLDLGTTPLANAYLTPAQVGMPEPAAPLVLQVCSECGLSQLTHVVDRDLMFRDYLYVSSTSKTFREHCAELAATAMRVAGAGAGDRAIDIASNDGLLLSCFKELGMTVLGVDPARNLAAEAAMRGIPTVPEFWSRAVAADALGRVGHAAIVTATNVLAHVDDVHEFADAVADVMAPDGILVVEVPYILDFIELNEFDTAYHEHLSYYGVHSMRRLLVAHGLSVFDVEHFPGLHGGTIRVFAARDGERTPSARVGAALDREAAFGIRDPETYVAFGERIRANIADLRRLIGVRERAGRRIWAYGASAKGNTLMNFAGLTAAAVPVVVDDNPKKWGLYTPGAHMRIVGPSELRDADVDDLLLLAWNFEPEIVQRSRAAGYRGAFIRPVPVVAVL